MRKCTHTREFWMLYRLYRLYDYDMYVETHDQVVLFINPVSFGRTCGSEQRDATVFQEFTCNESLISQQLKYYDRISALATATEHPNDRTLRNHHRVISVSLLSTVRARKLLHHVANSRHAVHDVMRKQQQCCA
jgi:hypothetical protein